MNRPAGEVTHEHAGCRRGGGDRLAGGGTTAFDGVCGVSALDVVLSLVGLTALAVAQPLLDLLGRNAVLRRPRDVDPAELVLLAVGLMPKRLLPPPRWSCWAGWCTASSVRACMR